MKLPVWVFLTKEWLKKWWKWLLLTLGLLLWFLGRMTAKKTVVITSTALEKADEAKATIDAAAAGKVREADAKEAAQLAGVAAQHSAAVASATQEQIDVVAAAQGDSDRVNAVLLDVGKGIRR